MAALAPLCRNLVLVLALLLGPGVPLAAASDSPAPQTTGLLWNRSGLPLTLPLEVVAPEGSDYRLTLLRETDREPVLAAAIRGGAFFRVLVPPGRYFLQFERGPRWLGQEEGFGATAETEVFTLPDPLSFSVTGFDQRQGHRVDLTILPPATPSDLMASATGLTTAIALCPRGLAPAAPRRLPAPDLRPLTEGAPGTFLRDLADETRLPFAERQGFADGGSRAQTPHRRGLPAPAPFPRASGAAAPAPVLPCVD